MKIFNLKNLNNILETPFVSFSRMALMCSIILLAACSEHKNSPFDKSGDAPGQISNIKIENTPGGAVIYYDVPNDKDLLYVEANFVTKAGKSFNQRSSSYNPKLVIEGLATTDKQPVKIITVAKSGAASEPISIDIEPLEPPYVKAARTLKMVPTFGGIKITVENESQAELGVFLGYVEDGKYVEYNAEYSNNSEITRSFRGLSSVERKYALYVRDKWDNFSDTIYDNLTPLFEEIIDKTKFRKVILQNDGPVYEGQGHIQMENLWDGLYSRSFGDPHAGNGTNWKNFSTRNEGSTEPCTFTFDMGAVAELNRMRVNNYWQYQNKGAKKYQVWGRKDAPQEDGSWDGWIMLGEFDMEKPSGLPADTDQFGPGDAEAWEAGQETEFDEFAGPVRYVRIRAIEDWQGFANFCAAEITLYGVSSN